jgi:hypothetical protein
MRATAFFAGVRAAVFFGAAFFTAVFARDFAATLRTGADFAFAFDFGAAFLEAAFFPALLRPRTVLAISIP